MSYNLTTKCYVICENNTSISNEEIMEAATCAVEMYDYISNMVVSNHITFLKDAEFCAKAQKEISEKVINIRNKYKSVEVEDPIFNPLNEIFQYLYEIPSVYHSIVYETYNGTANGNYLDAIRDLCKWGKRDAKLYTKSYVGKHFDIPKWLMEKI